MKGHLYRALAAASLLLSAEVGSLGWPSSTSMPCVPIVVSRSSRDSGEWTSWGNRSLMSSRAKRNPFGAVLHGAKGSLLTLQRQVQLRLREPKTETMLAWVPAFS